MMQAPGYHSAFWPVENHRLFVMEQVPVTARGAVLMCAPFLEERLFCRRVLRNLALSLADAGWHVLRFDSAGEGDSEGELFDVGALTTDRKSTRLNSSHVKISYAVFCLKKKKTYTVRRIRG